MVKPIRPARRFAWLALLGMLASGISHAFPIHIWAPESPSATSRNQDRNAVQTANEAKEAKNIFDALLKKLGRIKTLSMYVIHGNFTDGGSRTVKFPPPLHPKKGQESDTPQTILDCFNLTGSWAQYDRVRSGKFKGHPATILEHFAHDGADSYNILYISKHTGWPLADGYSLDAGNALARLSEFTKIRVTLKR